MKNKIFTSILVFLSIVSFSQSICDDAYTINTIPFFENNVNTASADSDTSGNYCNASGVAGKDTIFAFTPTSDVNIDAILSNVQINYDFLILMFIYDDCPDAAGVTCMQSATGGNLVLNDVALTAGNTYYIVVTNTNALGIDHFSFDIEVREHYQKDIEMTYFTQPHSTCQLVSPWQEISADIKNIGNDTVFGYMMRYDINGVIDSLDFLDDTLLIGEHKTIFYYKDLSIEYEYLVKVHVDYALDQNPENDTISVRVHNLGDVNTFPYLENFEDTSRWVAEWSKFVYDYPFSTKEETSWEWGEPNASVINSAAEGTKAVVSNLVGNCLNYERSVFMSPCFDFTSLSIPVIEFDMWKNLDSITSVYLEYTTNAGGTWTWTRIGTVGTGTNWYNEYQGYANDTWLGNSEGWVKARHRMANLGGESMVIFRFVIENPSTVTSEGFAIDNIRIYEAPNNDVGVSQILSPTSSCGLSEDSIRLVIKNYSPDSSHTGFDVRYVIDNGTTITETVNSVINPDDSLIYTFNATYDFSNIAEYKIFAETVLIADDDTTNDVDSIYIINFDNVTNLPYFNDFETNNANFFAIGENSSWQWGVPSDSVINTASSGTKIWVTNLSGYHNAPENTYLTSSCFDLSSMKRPYLKFKTWYDLYFLDGLTSSYVQVETSIDDGETWIVLGTSADDNWYKLGSAWTGTISSWEEMSHELLIESDIKFRFKLWALEAKTGVAIDDFEICDAPIAGFEYILSNGDIHFNDTSVNATSYQWIFSDGQSSSAQYPVMTFTQDTIIATQITTNSCFTDTIEQTVYVVGVNTLDYSDIKIFPNPVKDNLNIEFNKIYGEVYIEIVDVNSRLIYSKHIENNKTNSSLSINLTKFDAGMYFVKITTNKGELVKKIVK